MSQIIAAETLETIRQRRGDWYAYTNVDLGSASLGHIKLLRCGEGCSFKEPPKRLPDTTQEINWRYYLTGKVDLATGKITEAK
jgi:hypothetical protein